MFICSWDKVLIWTGWFPDIDWPERLYTLHNMMQHKSVFLIYFNHVLKSNLLNGCLTIIFLLLGCWLRSWTRGPRVGWWPGGRNLFPHGTHTCIYISPIFPTLIYLTYVTFTHPTSSIRYIRTVLPSISTFLMSHFIWYIL